MSRPIDEIKADLDAQLDRGRIKRVNVGGGHRADYLEAYDMIETANRIFGYDGWSYRVVNGPTFIELANLYTAEVEVTALNIWRTDIGTNVLAGTGSSHHEMSMKGAVSDGLKRALRTFGDQFGNSLYDKDGASEQGRPVASAQARGNGRSTPPSTEGVLTVNDFFSAVFRDLRLTRPDVLRRLGVDDPGEITDFAAARAALEAGQ